MKPFLDHNFLLNTKTAERLYHDYAAAMPIIDYHCHLPPDEIAANKNFENLTQAWLYGDHYKWRAMRANGVDEHYITGAASDWEKFQKWAETVPYTMRNPLYHWTHLELQRYFGIHKLLSPATAEAIYEECSEKLRQPDFSVRNLLLKMKVRVVGTTDDPLDELLAHQQIRQDGFEIRILPSFRPDKAMAAENLSALRQYIAGLEQVCRQSITDFDAYLTALKSRHDYFAQNHCAVSDHGLEQFYAAPFTHGEVSSIFRQIIAGGELGTADVIRFKSAMLYHFALWDHEKGWVQQYHVGALRNNNTRLVSSLGPDTGFDSIGDFPQASSMSAFLNRLDSENRLTKTILYNLNPADNEMVATMTGNFNDGRLPGKIQFGSAWWFLDQKDGMTRQLNALSNMGLLSRFIGMLTDSRSFLSYPRHEYFRRLLCDLLGADVEKGELPDDMEWLGKMVSDICYGNAKRYFNY